MDEDNIWCIAYVMHCRLLLELYVTFSKRFSNLDILRNVYFLSLISWPCLPVVDCFVTKEKGTFRTEFVTCIYESAWRRLSWKLLPVWLCGDDSPFCQITFIYCIAFLILHFRWITKIPVLSRTKLRYPQYSVIVVYVQYSPVEFM